MSRSAFAARFTELVGEPAMHYVARWRMHVALTWLREDDTASGQRDGESSRLRVGGGLQPGVQAFPRVLAWGGSTDEVRATVAGILGNRRYCYPLTVGEFASRYLLGLRGALHDAGMLRV